MQYVNEETAAAWFAAASEFDPTVLFNYGGIGILAFAAISVVVYLAKRDEKRLNAVNGLWEKRAEDWSTQKAELQEQLAAERARTQQATDEGSERVLDERRRGDRLEAELSDLNIRVQTEITTAMSNAAAAVTAALQLVNARPQRGD